MFVNGVTLALLELKNANDESATIISAALQQCQPCNSELPSLVAYNALLVASDGLQVRIGTLTAGREWFKPWRTISGEALARPYLRELQVLLAGVFDKRRVRDLIASSWFRRRRQRTAGQEDGWLPPVPCGEDRPRGNTPSDRTAQREPCG